MQNVSIHKAHELSPVVKSAVEQLLGRTIAPDEEVSVAAIPPQQAPPSAGRTELAREFAAYFDRRAEKIQDLLDAEIDGLIDHAVHRARHTRK